MNGLLPRNRVRERNKATAYEVSKERSTEKCRDVSVNQIIDPISPSSLKFKATDE